jgi:dipeptide/tripeptide permease
MKKIVTILAMVLCFANANAQAYSITVNAKGYKGGLTYLTYYSGNNLNIQDSGIMKKNGTITFAGKAKLLGGIYVLVLPDNRRIDFLIDKEQKINIKVDSADLVYKTIITGSKENILYQQYQKFITNKGRLREQAKQAYNKATTKADSVKL